GNVAEQKGQEYSGGSKGGWKLSVARRPLHMVASTGLERKQHKTFPSLALIRNVCLVLFAHNLWVFARQIQMPC
ncbi:MAG: hypothetical protein WBQ52_06700, partial [Terracidiphilus sp.]